MARYVVQSVVLLCGLLIGNISHAAAPPQALYLPGQTDSALILCHGRGKHPDWKVVSPLRKQVNQQMGWHTLSLQMPAEQKFWLEYADDFPAAYKTIEQAITFLINEKKVQRVYLMGHSMGARMASAYVARNQKNILNGLIVAGCRNNGDKPLSCDLSLSGVTIPVLDIWGDDNEKDATAAISREHLKTSFYRQQAIKGADHKFNAYETEFVTEVIRWLNQQANHH